MTFYITQKVINWWLLKYLNTSLMVHKKRLKLTRVTISFILLIGKKLRSLIKL